MKRKKYVLIIVLIICLIPAMYILIYKSNSIRNIPTGELISQVHSPNKDYKVNLYLIGGNATVDFAIRGELVNKLGIKKNIYWSYHEKDSSVRWINDKTIEINDKELNIKNEVYDWRLVD